MILIVSRLPLRLANMTHQLAPMIPTVFRPLRTSQLNKLYSLILINMNK